MNTLEIRKAIKIDLPGIMRLISQPDMSPDNRLTIEEAEALFENATGSDCCDTYVATVKSDIVGTFSLISIQHLSHNGTRSMIVEDVVVDSKLQGQGIGQAMMRFAIEQARRSGCYKMVLSSGEKRTEAHKFYEKLGFDKHGFSFRLDLG